jgi:hypothetical protein
MLRQEKENDHDDDAASDNSINNQETFPELIVDHVDLENAPADTNIHHPLLLDFIIVDDRAVEPPPIKPSWFWWIAQKSMLGLRVLLASCTANYSWPVASQPYEEMIAYGCIPYLEIVAGIYLFAWYDIHDIRDRLRAECRNDARLGFIALSSKIIAASVVPLLFGLAKGLVQSKYEEEIAANPVLKLLTTPPLSRVIGAVLALPMYMGVRKAINHFFPAGDFTFHTNPALKKWQIGAMILFRMIDDMSLFKFSATIYRAYGNSTLLHNKHTTIGAAVSDQLLANFIDAIAFSIPRPYPLRTLEPTQPMNLLPIGEANNNNDVRILLSSSHDNNINNVAHAYNEGRANVYRGSHQRFRCDNVKVTLWYSSRLATVLGVAVLTNYLLSLIQEDKETLSEPFYTIYLTFILLVTVGTELLFQNGLPVLINKLANAFNHCRHQPTLFHHADNAPPALPAPEEQDIASNSEATETTPLVKKIKPE